MASSAATAASASGGTAPPTASASGGAAPPPSGSGGGAYSATAQEMWARERGRVSYAFGACGHVRFNMVSAFSVRGRLPKPAEENDLEGDPFFMPPPTDGIVSAAAALVRSIATAGVQ
eukprot:3410910-Pyramimonas_sp.AAC.1